MFSSTLTLDHGTTLTLDRSTVIGRAPDTAPAVVSGSSNPVAIDDDSQLSRHHLQLTVDEQGVSITDLGSGNGTTVERNGQRNQLTAMVPMELRSGDVVLFGRQRAVVGLDAEFDATVIVGAKASAPAAPSPVEPPAPQTTVVPPRPTSPPPAPAPAPGAFVPGRAERPADAPEFVPGRADSFAPQQSPAGQHGPADGYTMSNTPASFGARLWGTVLDSVLYGLVMVGIILVAAVAWLIHPALTAIIGTGGYLGVIILYWRQLATTGQTWGRRIAGIRVVGARTGMPIGWGKAFIRFFVAGFSSSLLYLGYLWMLWDDKQQTWHDKVADSVVVKL